MTTPLLSRARRLGTFAAAGMTTLITTLAVGGAAAGATSPAQTAEPPRITVGATTSCSGGVPFSLDLFYDDHVDGHVPQAIHEELVEGSTVVRTRDELSQENGDYYNTMSYPAGAGTLNLTAVYTYSVTITYDDGVTQTQAATLDMATAPCPAPPPVTPVLTPPRTTMSSSVVTCPTASVAGAVRFAYDDHVDGHAPVSVHEELSDPSGLLWSIDDVHQVNGDYFNRRDFPATAAVPISATSQFVYQVTIAYDDGVIQTNSATLNVGVSCPAAGGVLPATL